MLRIAICDDESASLYEIKSLVQQFAFQANLMDYEIVLFSNSFDLLESIDRGNLFDVYLLDVFIDTINGIQLAQVLRKHRVPCNIIFLTNSKEFALDAFTVDASQYLIKPLQEQQLFHALENILSKPIKDSCIVLRLEEKLCPISIKDILYSEAHDKIQYVALYDEKPLPVRMTLKEMSELLEPYPEFVQCGRSLIINLIHIDYVENDRVRMDSGTVLYIPKGKSIQLKKQVLSYFIREEHS